MIESTPHLASTAEVVDELRRAQLRHGEPRKARRRHAWGRARARARAQATRKARRATFSRTPCRATCASCRTPVSCRASCRRICRADTLCVFCDMSDCTRAGELLPPVERENMLDIDHHLGNSLFGKLNYVLETRMLDRDGRHASAARRSACRSTGDIATCILTTIMTDTGGFMHSNTTPDVLELAAELMRARRRQGRDHRRDLPAQARRGDEAARADHRRDDASSTTAATATRTSTTRCSRRPAPTARTPRTSSTRCAVKTASKSPRCSRRSTARSASACARAAALNVQAAAQRLGGGGHFRASGLTFDGPLDDAFGAVEAALVRRPEAIFDATCDRVRQPL